MITSILPAKAAAVAAVAAAALGDAATAAYANVLPGPAQQFAHKAIGAPSPTVSHSPSPHQATPSGPDATGPAAFGLCTAYSHATAHGTAAQKAVAFRKLAAAAGGTGKIATYCAAVPHPGNSPAGAATAHPSGKPDSHPSAEPPSHPSGAPPASYPSGKPSSHPSGGPISRPAGRPTTGPQH